MPQAPPSQGSSLTVLGGPLDGAVYSLGTSFEELLLGSDPGCHVHIDLPGVSPLHANLLVEAAGVTVRPTRSPLGLYVNDDPVTAPTRLRDSDILWLGKPGEPASVMLLCHVVVLAPPVTVPVAVDEAFVVEDEPPAFVEAQPPAVVASEPEVIVDEFVVEPDPPPAGQASAEDADVFFVETPAPAPPADDVFFIEDQPPAPRPAVPAPAPRPRAPRPIAAPDEAAFVVDFVQPSKPPAEAHDTFVLDLPGDTPAQGVGAAPAVSRAAAPAPPAPPPAAEPLEFFVDEPPPAASAAPAPIVVPRPRTGAAPASAPRPAAAPAARPAAPSPAASSPVAPRSADAAAAAPRAPRPSAPQPRPAPVEPPTTAPRQAPAARLTAPPPPTPRPAARTARPASPAPAPRPAARASGGGGGKMMLAGGLVLLLLLAAGGGAGWLWYNTPRLDAVTPPRAHPGQVVRLTGARFSPAARVLVGEQLARVVKAGPDALEVEVPELPLTPGADRALSVVVRNGTRASGAVVLQGFVAPRLHGIAPDVALPGEEVELAGTGFGAQAEVRFGTLAAEVLQRAPDSLRVRVPALTGPPGTSAPVTVTLAGAASNSAPFFLGRLPLVLSVTPAQVAAGAVLELAGRGFRAEPGAVQVRVGGRAALLVEAKDASLRVVVPWGVAPGAAPIEVQVAGLEPLGQGQVDVSPAPAVVDFRFVAEPLDEAPDGSLAALATEWGPAFVLASSDGKSAARRALEAQERLNQAAVAIKASLSAEIEARFTDPPALVLRGRPEVLLEATAADAAAYARAGGRPVSPARLAAWWHAVARDLVLLLVRSERPQHTAALAGEGRALVEAFQAARRAAPFGVPRHVTESKGLRASLRPLALRVPAAVPEPALAPGTASAAAAVAPLKLEGTWAGRETVPEGRRSIAVTFQTRGGTFAIEGGLSLSVPLMGVERQRADGVRFSLRMAGGVRWYTGRWDGERVKGNVSSDAAGREVVGSFELAPR